MHARTPSPTDKLLAASRRISDELSPKPKLRPPQKTKANLLPTESTEWRTVGDNQKKTMGGLFSPTASKELTLGLNAASHMARASDILKKPLLNLPPRCSRYSSSSPCSSSSSSSSFPPRTATTNPALLPRLPFAVALLAPQQRFLPHHLSLGVDTLSISPTDLFPLLFSFCHPPPSRPPPPPALADSSPCYVLARSLAPASPRENPREITSPSTR